MSHTYFSDRELGPNPRTREEISTSAWGGIAVAIHALIGNGSFGLAFPDECPDGLGSVGTNEQTMQLALQAEIPNAPWPLDEYEIPSNPVPPTYVVLDLVEFCHRNVAQPIQAGFHPYFAHHHLDFNQEEGQRQFREKLNRIFARNNLAFELEDNGQIVRLGPPVLHEALRLATFSTGDTQLDSLLEDARVKYLDPDPKVRRESLEKLWDAWERIKTIEPGKDKKASAQAMLDKGASEPGFRDLLEAEAKELTRIGNGFQIRHSETTQTPIQRDEQVDYLFHRLFAMVYLLLRSR